MIERTAVRRALVSVYSKDGVVDLGRALAEHGAQILSTGGTMAALRAAGLPVTEVADYTGFPEMLDGRVKTLHPMIHGGLLARRDLPEHMDAIGRMGIGPIDLVCVNLYPFEETVADSRATREDIIEKIDIGGPSMLRSAAKNHDSVAVLCDPADYAEVIAALHEGGTTLEQRRRLAAKAFARTSTYDGAIAHWFAQDSGMGHLRYGENPHQQAVFLPDAPASGLGGAEILPGGGKELSYNNYLDLDAALGCAADLPAPAAAVIKHTNPCGAATASTMAEALARAWDGDPVSAFGSVIAVHGRFDRAAAEFLSTGQKFVECLAAPDFEPEAVEILRTKPKWGKNLRLLRVPDLASRPRGFEARRIAGGTLLMTSDPSNGYTENLKVAGKQPIPPGREADLRLAITLAKHLKSNSIAIVSGGILVGAGAGQMSRVDSARIAVEKAGSRARGAVAAGDAFFPFPDGVEVLARAGVIAVAHPGGSVKDAEVTAAADAHGMCMIHTGVRHFRH
ncbi:MAG: bifunctional phosphoribosylaminoimidazolecarboxamide formyltransferase/IMP cyclohydrolase [Planctomycetota bacterium]|nr:MAG: bifunctional phosphoribosylaminoimidazolecarboxamide formyltransferase/IMP cyclohydrolase [Planctomycetota bacterium]